MDGSLKVWDLKTGTVLQHIPPGTHEIFINGIDVHPEDSLLASISTDGNFQFVNNNGKFLFVTKRDYFKIFKILFLNFHVI